MKNIPLVVGNRVTYKDKYNENKIKTIIVLDKDYIEYLENTKLCEVIKVEACNWETIEFVEKIKEKKLFTEDEEEFLKSMIKWYNISTIEFTGTEILLKENGRIVCNPDYPENMKFENIKECKYYTLKELGLEV